MAGGRAGGDGQGGAHFPAETEEGDAEYGRHRRGGRAAVAWWRGSRGGERGGCAVDDSRGAERRLEEGRRRKGADTCPWRGRRSRWSM